MCIANKVTRYNTIILVKEKYLATVLVVVAKSSENICIGLRKRSGAIVSEPGSFVFCCGRAYQQVRGAQNEIQLGIFMFSFWGT